MKRVRRFLLAIMAIISLVSCITLMTDPAPSNGRATLAYDGVQVSMILPLSARGRRIPSQSPRMLIFANEVSDNHTVAAYVLIGEKVPSDKTDKEYLVWWMEQFNKELPKAPGRKGAVLRSVEHIGEIRSQGRTKDAHCVEYLWVSEDRLVPGHKGEAFIMHVHEYICIHPRAHVLIKAHFSERFPVERSKLRPSFNQDVAFFFDNLAFY